MENIFQYLIKVLDLVKKYMANYVMKLIQMEMKKKRK